MDRYGVIMAGGGGTRFWPLSREKTPKQLLNLSGKDLMVNEAVDRMSAVVEKDHIFIVTSQTQADSMVSATEGRIPAQNILAEPSARNTAACIGYAAMEITKKHGDGIMVITPADHYIEDIPALTDLFNKAIAAAEKDDKLITIGLKPQFPSTGFGYIRFNKADDNVTKKVVEFKEKPDEESAKVYVSSGEYVWNSGMFIWKDGLVLQKLKEYVPDIYEDLNTIGKAMRTLQEKSTLLNIYPGIRKISIDYAVMEPAASNGDVLVIPGDCGWNDVGSWDMMNILHEPDSNGNVLLGDVVGINVRDAVIYSSGRTVTALDVDNIVIVETADAVMVCRKDKAQNVKMIVDALKNTGRNELL